MTSAACADQRYITKMTEKVEACKAGWQYLQADHPIKGRVLSQYKGCCCYFEIGSNTIIATTAGDTVRIIGHCYTQEIVTSDYVVVNFEALEHYETIGDTKFDCSVTKTYYGTVSKIVK